MSAPLMHHVDLGRADARTTVLFLHAFPLTHAMWAAQIDALRGDSRSRARVVACDMRGFGETPLGDGQHMLEHFVTDVVALLDHLVIARAVVVGLSMGGYVALRLAERAPSRVAALVLADTKSEADGNEAKLKRAASMTALSSGDVAAFAEEFIETAFAPQTFAEQPDVIAHARAMIQTASAKAIRGALLALATRTDTTASLAAITVPTLVLVGAEDKLTPPATARATASAIRGAELHEIPGAAHMSNLEQPAAFNARLTAFVGRLDGATDNAT